MSANWLIQIFNSASPRFALLNRPSPLGEGQRTVRFLGWGRTLTSPLNPLSEKRRGDFKCPPVSPLRIRGGVGGEVWFLPFFHRQTRHDPRVEAALDMREIGEIVPFQQAGGALRPDARRALHEHGDLRGAQVLLEAKYVEDDESDPKAAWLATEFARLSRDFRLRAS